eukprot:6358398-Amphidinium_carterae.1
MSSELSMHCHKTTKGQPICFAWNQKNCPFTQKKAGARCPRGWHVCCKRTSSGTACGEHHALPDCPH